LSSIEQPFPVTAYLVKPVPDPPLTESGIGLNATEFLSAKATFRIRGFWLVLVGVKVNVKVTGGDITMLVPPDES
jgi:hypothetical protein